MTANKTKDARGASRLHAQLGATIAAMKLLEIAFAQQGDAVKFFSLQAQDFSRAYASAGTLKPHGITHGPQRKGKRGKAKRW